MKFKKLLIAAFVAVSLNSLSACTSTREREAESEVQEFTSWVDRRSSQVADFSEEQWKEVKQEYKQRTNQLDQLEDNLSREAKEQYSSARNKFSEWDRQMEQNMAERRRQEEEARMKAAAAAATGEMESELLGKYADSTSISATNIRDAYITFMQEVRDRRGGWTDVEWEQASMVLSKLNEQAKAVNNNISTKDRLKITALQAEFQSLKTGSDLKDVYKNEIKDTYKDVKD